MNAAKRNQERDQRERMDVSLNQVPEPLPLGGENLGRCNVRLGASMTRTPAGQLSEGDFKWDS